MNKPIKHICITGWNGSGKSVLLSLLNGHDNVFSIPVHDKIPFGLLQLQRNLKKGLDSRPIRQALNNSSYYNWELVAKDGGVTILISSKKDDKVFVPIEMNFYEFEESWNKKLFNMDLWSSEAVSNLIYQELSSILYSNYNKMDFFAYLGVKDMTLMEEYNEMFDNNLIIFVSRQIEGMIATSFDRVLPYESKKTYTKILRIKKIVNQSIKISFYELKVRNFCIKNPINTKEILFSDLIENKKEILKSTLEFLSLEYQDQQVYPTLLQTPLEVNGKSYDEAEHDDPKKTLSALEIYLIKFINIIIKKFGNIFLGS